MKFLWKVLKILILCVVLCLVAAVGVVGYLTLAPAQTSLPWLVRTFTPYQLQVANAQLQLLPSFKLMLQDFTVPALFGEDPLVVGEYAALALPAWQQLLVQPAVTELDLRHVAVIARVDATGQPNWQIAKVSANSWGNSGSQNTATGAGAALPTLFPVEKILVQNLSVEYLDIPTGVESRLQGLQVSLAAADAKLLEFASEGRYNGQAFRAQGHLNTADFNDMPIKLSGNIPALNFNVDGMIQDQGAFAGVVNANGPNLANLIATYAPYMALPVNLAERFTLSFKGSAAADALQLDVFNLAVNNRFDVQLTGSVEPQTLAYQLTQSSNSIDLDALGLCGQTAAGTERATRAEAGNNTTATDGSPWGDDPLPAFLPPTSGILQVQVNQLICSGYPRVKLLAQVTQTPKQLQFAPLEIALTNNPSQKIQQTLTLQSGQTLTGETQVTLVKFPLEQFIPATNATADLRLPLSGTISLTFQGNTTRELAQSLNGGVALRADEGRIPHADFAGFALNLEKALAGKMQASGDSGAVDTVRVVYSVTDGLFTAQDVLVRTAQGQVDLAGTGTIDLPNWQIDHVFEPRVQASSVLRVPLKVTGSLSAPQVVPQAVNVQNIATGVGAIVGGPAGAVLGNLLGQALGAAPAAATASQTQAAPQETLQETPEPVQQIKDVLKLFGQ